VLHWNGINKTSKGINRYFLKGPKLEIFGSGVFALNRPVWIGDLGTRPKISKS
jgi:hypothetical protein